MRSLATVAAASGWSGSRLDLARNPGLSFPEAMGTEGQLEGLYRFLNNDEVTFEAVHAPARRADAVAVPGARAGAGAARHHGAEVQRRPRRARAHPRRRRRTRLPASRQPGRDARPRTPLGVLGAETWARTKPPRRDLNRRHLRADPQRESLRWGRAVRACEQRLQRPARAIHVMDREGDNYDLLSELEAAQSRYVIRLSHDRRAGGRAREAQRGRRARADACFDARCTSVRAPSDVRTTTTPPARLARRRWKSRRWRWSCRARATSPLARRRA